MRKKIVAGNWKMNTTYSEAKDLAAGVLNGDKVNDVDVILFPPAIYAAELAIDLSTSSVQVGVQNVSEHDSGAYTGELSASMLQSVQMSHAIVGHSERRAYFNESNDVLALKVNQLLSHQITPIYCCGETLDERESDNHFGVVENQLEEGLFHLSEQGILSCVIAYEPVWAIGTGKTASSDQAQEMHAHIRQLVAGHYGEDISQNVSILYGGSCKPSNAKELFANQDVDGGLIGGASLSVDDFLAIVNSFG